ncbi:MAG: CheR family methyltransferase [Gammaproteobacteria bacterium]
MSLTQIEKLLHREIGLDASSIGSESIHKAVQTRMRECEATSIEHYWRLLCNNHDELRELVDEVVIPETWFFRNSDPFEMLIKFAREEWLPRQATTPLRILSIPCATGEEPYSIAIALIEAGFTPSQFHIDAMDISKRNIERCKKAYYSDYSFRGVDPVLRDRFFRARGSQYQLDILVRATTNFYQASLLDPNIVYTRRPYDVVFCRNLLIYFDRQTQQAARNMLRKLVTDDGILFVGHAETGGFIKDWFTSRRYPRAFALRKHSESSASPRPKNIVQPPSRHKATAAASAWRQRRPTSQPASQPAAALAPESRARRPVTAQLPSLRDAQALADQSRFVEAEAICVQHLHSDKQNAEAYYLLAMVQLAAGHPQTAVDYLKKVVYLHPRHIDALMFLATLTAEQGDPELARRYRERAQRARQRQDNGVLH